MAAGKTLPPRTNFPNRSVLLQLMKKPHGKKKRIGNLVVPRGLSSCSHLRIKNPVLFVASTRSFLVRYPATLFVEIHGDAAAHPVAERKHASKRRKHHKQQPSLIVTLRFVLALLSPPHWSSLAQFRPSAELPQLDGGIRTSHGPAHHAARITTRPESVLRPHWCDCMSV